MLKFSRSSCLIGGPKEWGFGQLRYQSSSVKGGKTSFSLELFKVLAGNERRTTSCVLSLARSSLDTLAMVFVRTYHTRCEQDEAIRRRDEVPKSKKARSICAGLLFEGRLPFYPKRAESVATLRLHRTRANRVKDPPSGVRGV